MTPHECRGVVTAKTAQANEYDGFEGNDGQGSTPMACVEYLSPYDALADADSPLAGDGKERSYNSSRKHKQYGFNSHTSWQAWREAVEGVDEPAVERIRDMAQRIIERVVGEASNRVEWIGSRVPAGALDVPAYLAGLPDVWSEPVLRPTIGAGRIIEINVNACCSAGLDESVLRARAIAALAMACAIEAAGGACEIWYGAAHATYDTFNITPTGTEDDVPVRGWATRILFKAASAPMDLAPIASWCASADGFRRGIFALLEHMHPAMRAAGSAYGHVADLPGAWQGAVPELAKGAHLAESQWETEASTIEWIETRLREMGVIK